MEVLRIISKPGVKKGVGRCPRKGKEKRITEKAKHGERWAWVRRCHKPAQEREQASKQKANAVAAACAIGQRGVRRVVHGERKLSAFMRKSALVSRTPDGSAERAMAQQALLLSYLFPFSLLQY